MKVFFERSDTAPERFKELIRARIAQVGPGARILELGAGANPLLSMSECASNGCRYSCLDISESEAAKAGSEYDFIIADIGSEKCEFDGNFDIVFSRMLAEHLPDGEIFHGNVAKALRPGGRAIHLFPTLYAPPFVLNKLLPNRLSEAVVGLLQPGVRATEGRLAKFPAHYSWCRGPTVGQIRRLRELGYDVTSYVGLFGHDGYYRRLPLLGSLHSRICEFLVRNPVSWLTSFSIIELTRLDGDVKP